MKPFWVTFYSYKGGVGRTLALVNSAVLLTQHRRNVLIVDFDLEAPGIDSFTELGVKANNPGVVEYFTEFARSGRAPQLSDYVEACPTVTGGGRLWMMPSGKKDREYNRMRDELVWSELYDTGVGALMIEEWKAEIQSQFQPDYVLVDSRTGLTDIGGVCTLHLPNLVALFFALNKQNINGIASVIAALKNAVTDQRPELITIASPIPAGATDTPEIEQVLENVSKQFGREIDLQISYNAAAALSEKIFALEHSRLRRPITVEYANLVTLIKLKNKGGLDELLRTAVEAIESDDDRLAAEVRSQLIQEYPERADAVQQVAEIARRFSGRDAAVPYWEKALQLDPSLDNAFNSLLNYFKSRGEFERVMQLCKARLKQRVEQRKEPETSTLGPLGEALLALGQPAEAIDVYAQCVQIAPAQIVYLFNLAEATRRATQKSPDKIWRSIIELFRDDRKQSQAIRANQSQAMYIPFACLGERSTARQLLLEAEERAQPLAPFTEIFCVKTYRFEKRDAFLEINAELLRCLEAGTLWDGMKLPEEVQKPTAET